MRSSVTLSLIQLLLFLLPKECRSSGHLSLQLVSFKNPKHVLYNGECCDMNSLCSWSHCENFFKFCVTLLGSTLDCSLGSTSTGVQGDDDFRFPGLGGRLGGALTNPLVYSFVAWKGASLVVEVWDDDSHQLIGKLPDFVDKYNLILIEPASMNKTRASAHELQLTGLHTQMNVVIKVFCDDNYLIPDCQAHCVPCDNTSGHFTCNYTAGVKVCLEGWYDPTTNCVKGKKFCIALNSTLGHYECDSKSGKKICLAGWTGKNCTEVWTPVPSLNVPPTRTKTEEAVEPSSIVTSRSIGSSRPHTVTASLLHSPIPTSTNMSFSQSDLTIPNHGTKLNAFAVGPTSAHEHRMSSLCTASIVKSNKNESGRTNKSFGARPTMRSTSFSISHGSELPHVSSNRMIASSLVAVTTPNTLSMNNRRNVPASSSARRIVPVPPVSGADTPKGADAVIIDFRSVTKWSPIEEEKLKRIIKHKLNKVCAVDWTSCTLHKSNFVESGIFNASHVVLKVANRSAGEMSLSVKVKLPEQVSVLAESNGFLSSTLLRKVIIQEKPLIESETGTTVVSVREVIFPATTDSPTVPTTETPTKVNETPSDPGVQTFPLLYLLVVSGSTFAILTLVVALWVLYKRFKRRNKVHKIHLLPESRPQPSQSNELAAIANNPRLQSHENSYTAAT